ncbi:MAG: hypothetical protein QM831_32885 [Kofleriaceae bacterium]
MLRNAILVAIALAGCTDDAAPPAGYGSDFGTAENPVPSYEPYVVRSKMTTPVDEPDVTAALANITAFSTHGGQTLLSVEASSASAVTLNGLSSTLKSNLPAWIDAELDKQKIGAVTARAAAGVIAMQAQAIIESPILESSLKISPEGSVHTLLDLAFEPAGATIVVPIGGLQADKLDQKPDVTVGAGGALTIGDQTFGLAFGAHAWQGINLAMTNTYGGDLTMLQNLDCAKVATAVAAKCSGSSCVGHASDIQAVCTQGLAALVSDLRDSLSPIELDSIHFAHGAAKLVDAGGDGVAEKMTNGTWDAQISDKASQIGFTADL